MAVDFAAQFARPAWWDFFQPVIDALDDDMLRIDPVTFMERIGPVIAAHADYSCPRAITKSHGGSRPQTIHYFVLPRYWHADLQYHGMRLVAIHSTGGVRVLDVTRMPKSVARQASLPSASAQKFFDALLNSSLESLHKKTGRHAMWQDDIGFIDRADARFFETDGTFVAQTADAMMAAADDLIGNSYADRHKRAFIRERLIDSIVRYVQGRKRETAALLEQARGLLDQEALFVLRDNPSALSAHNYHWLTDRKNPHLLPHRREVAKTYPVLMLTPLTGNALAGNDLPQMLRERTLLARTLHIKTPQAADFYEGLHESQIGAENAVRLPQIAPLLETLPYGLRTPRTPQAWSRLLTCLDVARLVSKIVDRPLENVFEELAVYQDRADDQTLTRYFTGKAHGEARILDDLRVWKNRIVASVLAPKIVSEGRTQGLNVPIQAAFFLASGKEYGRTKNRPHLNGSVTQAIADFVRERSVIAHFLDGTPVEHILDAAFDFGTHKGAWDERVRDIVITNRLFEHASDHAWPHLPTIELPADFYTVVPHRNLADLLKDCLEARSDLWMEGHKAVTGPYHFLSLRRKGAAVSALVMVREPQDTDGAWTIERIDRSGHDLRNVYFEQIVQSYLHHPDFVAATHLPTYAQARRALTGALLTQAKDSELMGFREGDRKERAAMIQALTPYIRTGEEWDIDERGCISGLKINAVTQAALRAVAPYCRP